MSIAILRRLESLHPKYINLNLNRILRLLNDLNNPELRLPPVIHVAGTNGKGSVISFLRNMIEESGLKTHVYTSPHLVKFNERIRTNGEIIDDSLLNQTLLEVEKVNNGKSITFFEITTAAALLIFSRIKSDFLLLEVGLGGRLDATNVVTKPLATIITAIGFDHQNYLGNTIQKITYEKSGIIKSKCPVLTLKQSPKINKIIKMKAKLLKSDLHIIDDTIIRKKFSNRSQIIKINGENIILPPPSLHGNHQLDNAALAALSLFFNKSKINSFDFYKSLDGLKKTKWPARIQEMNKGYLIERIPNYKNRMIIIDGAHNTLGAKVLSKQLIKFNPGKWLLVYGALKAKDPLSFLKIMKKISNEIITIKIPYQKDAISSKELAILAKDCGFETIQSMSIKDAFSKIKPNNLPICICGSLYLAGEIIKLNNNFTK